MVYVEADQPNKLTLDYMPNQQDLSDLTQLIKVVWQKIMKLDFPDTSHYQPTLEGIKQFSNDLKKGAV